ncbi:MAG: Trk family potassium uptake protein, partial [Clostridiales bacterium]|nr:Trk family potassium uptake protein [Clostridiales bacterium]
MFQIFKRKITMLQFLALGFFAVILTGALLLMLPISNVDGGTIRFIDAMVTATSATCVTGLTVFDLYSQFTHFGQAVIITLIQIGGLGFMTIIIFLMMATGRRIGLTERSIGQEALGALKIGGIVRLVRLALFGTLVVQFVGAI